MSSLSLVVLLFALLPLLSHGQDMRSQTCSRDNSVVIQSGAAAWIGGIISLNEGGSGGYGCGNPSGSMQSYEAIRWVLDLLNKKDEFLQLEYLTDYYVPGIKLGMVAINYCENERSSVAAISKIFTQLQGDSDVCTKRNDDLNIGIIGGSSSDSAILLSEEAALYNIPVISYEATTPQLTLPNMYTNFMRTISPDGPLMEVIVQVLLNLKWNYVAVVYDSGVAGRSAYSELHSRIVAAGICLTAGIMVDGDDLSTTRDALNKVLNTDTTGVIYFGPSAFAKDLIRVGNDMLPASGRLQWLFSDFPLDGSFGVNSVYQRGIISVTSASRFIVEFEDHWIRINETAHSIQPGENPWFRQWFEERNGCSFFPAVNEVNCASLTEVNELEKRATYQQDQYVEAAIMSVFTYARALREAQMTKCPGVSGPCQALADMTRDDFYNNFLTKVDFTFTSDERVPSLASKNVDPYNAAKHLKFTANGDIADASYYIWNFNDIETGSGPDTFKFRRVGSYINGYLDLNNVGMYSDSRTTRVVPLPASPCPVEGCMPCLGLPADIKYYYEPGDVVINGIFSLHNAGLSPLTCGTTISPNQFQYMEAMIYAIKRVNEDNTVLPRIRLGGLGVDDCSSSALSQGFLAQVQRGDLRITSIGSGDLDPRTIEAYTAAYTSALTLPLAEAMNSLMRPMVGYRAGSSQLDDQQRYPYFIRALPGIEEEIQAIILLLKRWNWMNVQVITSEMEYSRDAESVFRRLAAKAGICIVAEHHIGTTSTDAARVVQGLDAYKNAPPAISLLEMQNNQRLLHALADKPVVRKGIALIATTTWGTDEMIVNGYEGVADGLLSLSLRRSTLNSFQNHMRDLRPNTYTTNPWFQEWYAATRNCSLDSANVGQSICDSSKPITDANTDANTISNYRLMYQVESVINSIQAIARGLDSTLQSYCGVNYAGLCSRFVSSADKGKRFLEEIRKISFSIEDMAPPNTFRFSGQSGVVPFELYNYRSVSASYQLVGTIDPWGGTVSLSTASIVLNSGEVPTSLVTTCPGPCLECLYIFNYMDYRYIPGDVVVGAIFDVHYAGSGPFTCGAARTKNGGLYTEVFNFALQKINAGTASVILDNFRLGGLSFDGCTNPSRAVAIVNRVHTGMDLVADSGERFMSRSLVSWLTYDSKTTVEAAKLVQSLDMSIVTPGATTNELDDKNVFTTLFRTIPSDSIVVKAMAEFINEMRWNYVIVVNSPDQSNRQSKDQFIQYLGTYGICAVATYEFDTDGNMDVILESIGRADTQVVAVFAEPDQYVEDFIRTRVNDNNRLKPFTFVSNRPWGRFAESYYAYLGGSVFFQLQSPAIAEFTTYLNTLSVLSSGNPWFEDLYQEVFSCNLQGNFKFNRNCDINSPITSSTNWEQDIWTLSTMNAVYALADAVNKLKVELCGQSYQGICDEFFFNTDTQDRIRAYMDQTNFQDITQQTFQFIEREADRGYQVYRFQNLLAPQLEGTANSAGVLSLTDSDRLRVLYTNVRSECLGDCFECRSADANLQDFTLVPGDIYIVGLFDVHNPGATPFTCGAINEKHGLPLLEAFNYALQYVNNRTGIFRDKLQGVQLGGIGLDMCQSPTRAANLVANIHGGTISLSKGGTTVDPKRIDAYVATMDTESSVRVADILTQLAMPQISYGATGMDLLDRERYTYFLRSVPADDKQARAIVSYLKKFQFNNIQVIYSFDEIGEPGAKEFERVANVNKICLNRKLVIGERGGITDANAADAIRELQVPNGAAAQVIVLWMKNPLPILEAASNNAAVSQNYLFIATDKWGADPDYLKLPSLYNLLENRNLVILDVETADIPGFDRYLEHKTPDTYTRNPWFKEYFETHQRCSWDAAVGAAACDKSATIPRADNYVQDPYVLYVVNAVFSAAIGIDRALQNLCRGAVFGVCNLYRTSGERRQKVLQGLKEVNFKDDTHQPFFFTEDGQSDRGFHVYNVTSEAGSFVYKNVGSYNDSDFLKLDITYGSQYSAYCDADRDDPLVEDCICPFPPAAPSRFMKKEDGKRGLALVYIGDIHQVDPDNSLACGPINTGVDLQKLLAFFYAIERVNSNADFSLPDSIKLDGLALDSCTHALRLGQDVYNVLSGNTLCDSDSTSQLVSPSSIVGFVIDQDRNAIPVSNMLSLQRITTISPTAGNDILNDRFNHPYFLRTRGDNDQLAQVILQISQQANWNFLSIIYSDNIAQRGARDALLGKSASASTCIGDTVPLAPTATQADAEDVLGRISQQVGARGVVLFVEPEHFRLLLQASQALGLTGRFVWIVPSNWAHDGSNINGFEQEAAGAIMVETRSAVVDDFLNYVKSLTFTNRRGIPDDWFEEIFEALHQCHILDLEETTATTSFSRICSKDEVITDDMISTDPAVLHVIISVFSAALGLSNIPECTGTTLDVAACLQLNENRNDLIYRGIFGVTFRVLPELLGDASFEFSFDQNGNGQAGYIINNYQASSGRGEIYRLGEYTTDGLTINLNEYMTNNPLNRGELPVSSCASGTTCTCKLTGGRTWSFTPVGYLNMDNIEVGGVYTDALTGEAVIVNAIPGPSDRFSDTWAIIVAVLAAIGALVSLVLFVYLLVMYPVRGGTSILGYILAFGIVLLYLMVFAFIAHADERICGLRRFGLGFVYAIVYSALLVKLVDCWRVRGKGEEYSIKYSKLGRPFGLFMVTLFFVLVQVMIDSEWLILREPKIVRIFYNNQYWPRCTPDDNSDEDLVLSLVYIMVLIAFSFLLGLVTFTSTKNHRESRWILGILILTIPCWVIWCSVTVLGAIKVRDAAVAVGLLINATVILLLVPVRKLYLLHKYNVLIEEEEEELQSQVAASYRGDDYNSLYGRQYDNRPKLHDTGSTHGSTQYSVPPHSNRGY